MHRVSLFHSDRKYSTQIVNNLIKFETDHLDVFVYS